MISFKRTRLQEQASTSTLQSSPRCYHSPCSNAQLTLFLYQVRRLHMPQTPHTERHFTASEVVRDIVIGMSDGLTVPFALAAGLTGGLHGASNPTAIIVTAGLAEIAA